MLLWRRIGLADSGEGAASRRCWWAARCWPRFYVPFVLNPSFGVTYAYITVNRIGTTFPYNNLSDFFERTTLYSTIYYVALMVVVRLIALARIYRRGLRGVLGWIAAGLLVGGHGRCPVGNRPG